MRNVTISLALIAIFYFSLGACSSDDVPDPSAGGGGSSGASGRTEDSGTAVADGSSGNGDTDGAAGGDGKDADGGDGGGGNGGGGTTGGPPCVANRFVTAAAGGSGNGTSASPWTLAQAMANAVAGDCVQVGPGTYVGAHTGTRYCPAFNPAHAGTVTQPIVFFAQYPAVYNTSQRSELRNNASAIDGGSPTFGVCNHANYITWDGFYVSEANAHSTADTGPVVVWSSRGVRLSRNVIVGEPLNRQDNHCGIRFEFAADSEVTNNDISGFALAQAGSHSQNYAGIMAYDSHDIVVEHNDFHGNDVDIFIKGWHDWEPGATLSSWTVRYNRMRGARNTSLHFGGVNSVAGAARTVVSHNLIVNAASAFNLHSFNAETPRDIDIHHNTIVGYTEHATLLWITGGQVNVKVFANLIQGSKLALDFSQIDGTTLQAMKARGFDINDNHYFGQSQIAKVGQPNGGSYASPSALAAGTTFGNPGTGFERDGSSGDPLFVNAAGGDYHLKPGSPAATAAIGGGAVGCYQAGTERIGILPAQ